MPTSQGLSSLGSLPTPQTRPLFNAGTAPSQSGWFETAYNTTQRGPTMALAWAHAGSGFAADPSWEGMTGEEWGTFLSEVPEQYRDDFDNVESLEEAHFLRAKALEQFRRDQVIANAGGVTAVTAGLVGSLMDPLLAGATLLSGGASGAAFAAAANPASGALVAGAIGGTTFGGLEAIAASQDSTDRTGDVARALVGGFAGGAAGAPFAAASRTQRFIAGGGAAGVSGSVIDAVDPNVSNRQLVANFATQFVLNGAFNAIGKPQKVTTPDGVTQTVAAFDADLDTAARQVVTNTVPNPSKVESVLAVSTGQTFGSFNPNDPVAATTVQGAVGAASAQTIKYESVQPPRTPPAEKMGMDFRPEAIDGEAQSRSVFGINAGLSKTALGRAVVSKLEPMGVSMSKSGDALMRAISNKLAFDPLPKVGADGSEVRISQTADQWVDTTRATLYSPLKSLYDSAWMETRKGIPSRQWGDAEQRFQSEIAYARRSIDAGLPTNTINPRAVEVAQAYYDLDQTVAGMKERHSVPGYQKIIDAQGNLFGEAEPITHSMPRIWNRPGLDRLVEKFGRDNVRGFIANAIEKRQRVTNKPMAEFLANTIIENGGTNNELAESLARGWFSKSDRAAITQAATKLGLSQQFADDLFYAFSPETDAKGAGRLKSRIDLDHTHVETLTDKFGDSETVSLHDLMHNNTLEIADSTLRRDLGDAAWFETMRDLGIEGVETSEDLGTYLQQRYKDNPAMMDANRDNIKNAVALSKIVRNRRPIDDTISNMDAIQAIRSAQTFRLLADAGTTLANAAELAPMVARQGWKAVLAEIPAVGEMWKAIRTSDRTFNANDPQWIRDAFEMIPADSMLDRHISRYDVGDDIYSNQPNTVNARRMSKLKENANRLSRFGMTYSGQSFVTEFMHLMTQRSTLNTLGMFAKGEKPLSEGHLSILRLTRDEANLIGKQIAKHGTYDPSAPATRLLSANEWAWDKSAESLAPKYRQAVYNSVRSNIQANNPTQYALWMHTGVGKILAQMRSFGFLAQRGKFLAGADRVLRYKDVREASAMLASMAAGSIVYMARAYYNAQTSENPDKALKENLSAKSIALAGVGRSAYSGLMPMYFDTAWSLTQNKPVFSFARTSGIGNSPGVIGVLMGNPVIDWGTNAILAGTGPLAAATRDDYSFSQRDVKRIQDALFLNKMFGLTRVFNKVVLEHSGLPKTSTGEN